jgi:hypothetical protein
MAASAAKPVLYPPVEKPAPVLAAVRIGPGVLSPASEPFGAWLINQAKRPGTIGELARAIKLDRKFPKSGSADDVRRHFGSIGAEGDAFEALDDAEREYDRMC